MIRFEAWYLSADAAGGWAWQVSALGDDVSSGGFPPLVLALVLAEGKADSEHEAQYVAEVYVKGHRERLEMSSQFKAPYTYEV